MTKMSNKPENDLSGKVLLADPRLRDGHFFRSVILITEHGDEGAHGYIINSPLHRSVGDFLSGGDFQLLAEVPVYRGGPVGIEKLSFATMGWDNTIGSFSFNPHLTADQAQSAYLAGKDVRAYVGYSGWSSGQLEAELESHSWLVHKSLPILAESDAIPDLWVHILREMGPWFELISHLPPRPELN